MPSSLKHLLICVAIVAGLPVLGAAPAQAALLKVDELIYGMSCATCAYGMTKALLQVPGVQKVTVNLNTGIAGITLAPHNSVTMKQIDATVHRAGFNPQHGRVVISGVLARAGDGLMVKTAHGGIYHLQRDASHTAAWRIVENFKVGSRILLRGIVRSRQPTELLVHSIEAAHHQAGRIKRKA